jgi:hypothetical protein
MGFMNIGLWGIRIDASNGARVVVKVTYFNSFYADGNGER